MQALAECHVPQEAPGCSHRQYNADHLHGFSKEGERKRRDRTLEAMKKIHCKHQGEHLADKCVKDALWHI